MVAESTQAKEIIRIVKAAGRKGTTRAEISRAVSDKGCDCENWINTLLEAGIIKRCGKRDGAYLYRLSE